MTDLTCSGPHTAPVVVGTVTGAGQPPVTLCDDCQLAYAALAARGRLAGGQLPTRRQVDDELKAAGRSRTTP